MRRAAFALAAAALLVSVALLTGGKAGLVGGVAALAILAAGVLRPAPALVSAAGGVVAAAFVVGLLAAPGRAALQAPLAGLLLLLALEAGHLAVEGRRYSMPGGAAALAARGTLTAGVALAGFAAAWLALLAAWWVPRPGGPLGLVGGALAPVAVLVLLAWLARHEKTPAAQESPGSGVKG